MHTPISKRRLERFIWLHGPWLLPSGLLGGTLLAVFLWDAQQVAKNFSAALEVIKDYGDFLGAIVGVLGAYGIFRVGERGRAKAAQVELERSALLDFISSLHARIASGDGPTSNRQLLELSFHSQDRRITRWMSEMLLEIFTLLVAAEKGEIPESRMWSAYNETADVLTKWHHRELVTSDFDAPFAIRALARLSDRDPSEYAAEIGLTEFLRPQRLYAKKEADLFDALVIRDGLFDLIAPHLTGRQFARGTRRIQWKLLKVRLAVMRSRLRRTLIGFMVPLGLAKRS